MSSVKLRVQQIIIDLPRSNSERWIHMTIQRVELDDDGNEANVVDRWGQISQKMSDVFAEAHPYSDPITGGSGLLSVAGTAVAISSVALAWMTERWGGTVNELGDLILDGSN